MTQVEQSALEAGGIRIASLEDSDDGSRYHVDAEILFESLESLSSFSGIGFSRENSGANTILTVDLSRGDGEVSEKALDIVRKRLSLG